MGNEDKHREAPPDNDFQQQKLAEWTPLTTPFSVIWILYIFGVLLGCVGYVVQTYSDKVVEFEAEYKDYEGVTKITIDITKDMKKPVFFYYKLSNFYQNHRRYIKSRSDDQLQGKQNPVTEKCDVLEYAHDKKIPYYPCGLAASGMFNDNFTSIQTSRPTHPLKDVKKTDTGIAWPGDAKVKFVEPDPEYEPKDINTTGYHNGEQLPSVGDENFMVWMRTAPLPTFKKLRYVIDEDLEKDSQLIITVDNKFNVDGFDGKKYLCISTISWIGGKCDFLAYAYLCTAAACILFGTMFLVKQLLCPRTMGDMRYFHFLKFEREKERLDDARMVRQSAYGAELMIDAPAVDS